MELLLSADRVPASVAARAPRPATQLPSTAAQSSPAQSSPAQSAPDVPCPLLGKKKIQLKKKSPPAVPASIAGVPQGSTGGSATTGAASKLNPGTVAIKKKKLGMVVCNQSSNTDSLKKNIGLTATKHGISGKIPTSFVKPNLCQRSIIKPGNQTAAGIKPRLGGKETTVVPGSKAGQLNKSTVIKKQPGLPVSPAVLGLKVKEPVKSEPTNLTRKTAGAAIDAKAGMATSTEKQDKGLVSSEAPFQAVCHLASLHNLAAAAPTFPIGVSHWLKDLTACIQRCQT